MVIPTPAFSLYDTVTRLAGAVPVPVDTSKDGFQLTASSLEAALTPKTKVLILNSPNNPTGVVYTPEHLAAIDRITREPGSCLYSVTTCTGASAPAPPSPSWPMGGTGFWRSRASPSPTP